MKPETKEKISKWALANGYKSQPSDYDIIEIITDCGKVVWEGSQDRHRWYSMIPTVVKLGDMFIQYDYCDVHGEEANIEDCIGGYKLDNFVEVVPVEVKAIEYKLL